MGSQAAVSISNMRLVKDLEKLLMLEQTSLHNWSDADWDFYEGVMDKKYGLDDYGPFIEDVDFY